MKSAITPLNLFLALILIVALVFMIERVTATDTRVRLPRVSETLIEDQVKKSLDIPEHDTEEFDVAAMTNNLFHPQRRIVKGEPRAAKTPRIVLYGTFVSDSLSMAYVEDIMNPKMSSSGAKRQVAVQKGDSISGFIVDEIYPDRIVLKRNQQSVTVVMDDKKERPARGSESGLAPDQPAQPQQDQPFHQEEAVEERDHAATLRMMEEMFRAHEENQRRQ